MSYNDVIDGMNKACLEIFGQAFFFTPVSTGIPQSIAGILDEGVEMENGTPGDGSVYARLWTWADGVNPVPVEGDEIRGQSAVYRIARIERDAANGIWMLLRKDRDA
ncbi:MAG: hypothetical protein QUT30_05775 [Acidobacteriota bacterium]|jgi:hypothetical protein|nr:hypothetical protein [Acidobacteriota bacterium]